MISIPSNIEDTLTNLLQQRIALEIDGKVIKTGKLILFTSKYFFISLTIETLKKSKEKVEIPIPYSIEVHNEDKLIYFDYRLSTLTKTSASAKKIIEKMSSSKNKFYNKILIIEIKNDH
jgi:hypothetical protein